MLMAAEKAGAGVVGDLVLFQAVRGQQADAFGELLVGGGGVVEAEALAGRPLGDGEGGDEGKGQKGGQKVHDTSP